MSGPNTRTQWRYFNLSIRSFYMYLEARVVANNNTWTDLSWFSLSYRQPHRLGACPNLPRAVCSVADKNRNTFHHSVSLPGISTIIRYRVPHVKFSYRVLSRVVRIWVARLRSNYSVFSFAFIILRRSFSRSDTENLL